MQDSDKKSLVLKITINVDSESDIGKNLATKVDELVRSLLNESLNSDQLNYRLSLCPFDRDRE